MCEQCGEKKSTKKYTVLDGDGTIIHICNDCAEWLKEGQPEYDFVKYDTTCELSEPAEWEPCEDPHAVIQENADWL